MKRTYIVGGGPLGRLVQVCLERAFAETPNVQVELAQEEARTEVSTSWPKMHVPCLPEKYGLEKNFWAQRSMEFKSSCELFMRICGSVTAAVGLKQPPSAIKKAGEQELSEEGILEV